MTAATAAAGWRGSPAGSALVGAVVAGARRSRGHDLGEQGLVLELVEKARRRIAAGGLPTLEHGAGVVIERAGRLGVEAETVEAALHVAALTLVEADLVLGELAGVIGARGGTDPALAVPGGR